jgi:hypothetical protein
MLSSTRSMRMVGKDEVRMFETGRAYPDVFDQPAAGLCWIYEAAGFE